MAHTTAVLSSNMCIRIAIAVILVCYWYLSAFFLLSLYSCYHENGNAGSSDNSLVIRSSPNGPAFPILRGVRSALTVLRDYYAAFLQLPTMRLRFQGF